MRCFIGFALANNILASHTSRSHSPDKGKQSQTWRSLAEASVTSASPMPTIRLCCPGAPAHGITGSQGDEQILHIPPYPEEGAKHPSVAIDGSRKKI